MILDLAALNIRMAAYKVLCAQAMDEARGNPTLLQSAEPPMLFFGKQLYMCVCVCVRLECGALKPAQHQLRSRVHKPCCNAPSKHQAAQRPPGSCCFCIRHCVSFSTGLRCPKSPHATRLSQPHSRLQPTIPTFCRRIECHGQVLMCGIALLVTIVAWPALGLWAPASLRDIP